MQGRRHRQRISLFVVLALCAGSAAPALAQVQPRVELVNLGPGTGEKIVESSVTGYEVIDYRVAVMAGQTLSVTLDTNSGANYFNVLPPDSTDEAMFVGSSSGLRFAAPLDLDGEWTIRVYQVRAAARRGETARYSLAIALTGASDPGQARVANDFGPSEWDARGAVGCAFAGQPMQTAACPFKVIRYRYEEGATVFIQAPADRGVRILYFLNGEWSTNSAAGVGVRKRADLWSLVVEEEAYEIPEAVIFGG